MRPRVRVVDANEPPQEVSFDEALDALVKECKAAMPVSAMLVWEVGESDMPFARSVPNSIALRQGIVVRLSHMIFPDGPDE